MMLVAQTPAEDPVTWLDIAPIVISGLALAVTVIFGLRNRGTSKKALNLAERQVFFVRMNNSTRALPEPNAESYRTQHWSTS